jgi:hypothetical protein
VPECTLHPTPLSSVPQANTYTTRY